MMMYLYLLTGMPIFMKWITLRSFEKIPDPKYNPVPTRTASPTPNTKLIWTIQKKGLLVFSFHVLGQFFTFDSR